MRVRFVEKDGSETWRELSHVNCDVYIVPVERARIATVDDFRMIDLNKIGVPQPVKTTNRYYKRHITRFGSGESDFTAHFEFESER